MKELNIEHEGGHKLTIKMLRPSFQFDIEKAYIVKFLVPMLEILFFQSWKKIRGTP